ncbi:hypothetical protein [Methylomonas koyamae]|uniref:hypothetical protein n=1 Tax=Methylomonas koyamae TaxID=702114 RepID=UPI002872BD8C|nr:hypothetical protein [Methylomonas koyamae]WNB75522.1 hypothetical protein RI210_19925 [Methylomonas koyamae]
MKEKSIDPYPWSIFAPYILDIILFALSFVILVIGYIASENLWLNEYNWLQRFSSAIIVLAIIIDYRHLNFYKPNPTHQAVLSGGLTAPYLNGVAKFRYFIGVSSVPMIALGTILSGFGDILFKP